MWCCDCNCGWGHEMQILLTLVQTFFLVSCMMAYGFWLSGFPDAFASQIPHSSQEFWSHFFKISNSKDEKKKGKIKTNNDKSIIQWVDIVIRTQIGHDSRVMSTYYHNSFSLSNQMNGNRYFHWMVV
jgi:hypothetical protein